MIKRPITKRRRQKRLSYESERLRALVDSMTAGVIALDDRLKIELYNGAALGILDSNASIKGAAIDKHMHLVDKNNQPVDLRHLIETSTTASSYRTYRMVYSDGNWISLHLNISPVARSYGKLASTGYVLILRDITKEKSLEDERNEFISVVSHELRTPVTIAEGGLSNAILMAEREGASEAIKKALDTAHQQTIFLAEMINDLSTLSRAERGKLTLDLTTVDMKELVQNLAADYTEQLVERGLHMHVRLPRGKAEVHSSPLYIREILQNLVTNAVKYTAEGSVTLELESSRKGIVVHVKDTGIGISRADQERVFDKFFRSEDFRTRESSGTGLGLYVTMKLVDLLHADMSLTSHLNQGSTFSVRFPNID